MLKEPAELFRRAIAIGDEWNDLPLQNAHHKLGEILYEWNRLDEAREHAESRNASFGKWEQSFTWRRSACSMRGSQRPTGNGTRAFDEIERAIAASSPAGYTGITPVLEEVQMPDVAGH